ncbi:RING finger 32 isoform X1 [Pelobates cultripes]|uniref:RING finger 32 isoform X1 n=1 Tax=Pelobates cultripes TaxID=61616 RepID=A0AAD1RVG1_PELCU|nr:RING finger 32 isoform X1 [Pelobates cultripes]
MDRHSSSRSNGSASKKQEPVVLTAVALQDHILQNLDLQDLSLCDVFHTHKRTKKTSHRPINRNLVKAVVDTGIRRKSPTKLTVPNAEEEYVLDPFPPPLTLAQKLGIVEAPAMPLTPEEWGKVKKRSIDQGDSSQPCVICKEDFQLQAQVLLSCSHVFHRVCLQAFEKFTGKKTCPMCRKSQYQTRVIHDGAHLFKAKCATRIQACWRGYVVRKWYKNLRHTIPPKNPMLRKKFFEEKLTEITDRLLRSFQTDIDVFFNEIDNSIAVSRNVFLQLEDKYSPGISEGEWEKIQIQAVRQEIFDCPICIMPLHHKTDSSRKDDIMDQSTRPVVLLSCSHVFHFACLQAFEEFTTGDIPICPLCRSFYKKKLVSS